MNACSIFVTLVNLVAYIVVLLEFVIKILKYRFTSLKTTNNACHFTILFTTQNKNATYKINIST